MQTLLFIVLCVTTAAATFVLIFGATNAFEIQINKESQQKILFSNFNGFSFPSISFSCLFL